MSQLLKRMMVGVLSAIVLGIGMFFVLLSVSLEEAPSVVSTLGPLVIEHVSWVDLDRGVTHDDQVVVIENGRIQSLGPQTSLSIPRGSTRIDGEGKFLIPGLWDMHAHHGSEYSPQLAMPLWIANGVTGIRDMGGYASLEMKNQWRRQIEAGELLGPRILGQTGRLVSWLNDEQEAI